MIYYVVTALTHLAISTCTSWRSRTVQLLDGLHAHESVPPSATVGQGSTINHPTHPPRPPRPTDLATTSPVDCPPPIELPVRRRGGDGDRYPAIFADRNGA